METKPQTFNDEITLATYSGEDRVISIEEVRAELENNARPLVKVMSKMPQLDSIIEGFEGGELIALSGPTKNGKTTFAQTLTRNFEEQGLHTLWFSYEVPLRQLATKYIHCNNFFVPRRLQDKTIEWLEQRITEAKLKYNVKCVVIDHLHYLVDLERISSPSIEIGSIVRKLKLMSIEKNIIIFLLAHSKKTREDGVPTEGDVRDSSFIPQEADSTFMIWRERKRNKQTREFEYTDRNFLIISNHRRTGVMDKRVELVFKDGLFYESASIPKEAITEKPEDTVVPEGGLF